MSRSSTNLTVMLALPSLMRCDGISSMPAMLLSAFSIGSTTARGHLVGARAGQLQRDVDGRRIGLGKQIDAEIAEREDAQHHERHHQHRGEDRAAGRRVRTARISVALLASADW